MNIKSKETIKIRDRLILVDEMGGMGECFEDADEALESGAWEGGVSLYDADSEWRAVV